LESTGNNVSGLDVTAISLRLGDVWVLREVTIAVGSGEIVALLGPSGAGKTSLLRVIAGLIEPDAGSVKWDGHDLRGEPAHRRRMGMVFQDALLFPHRDVAGNIGYGLEIGGERQSAIAARIEELLELVGLSGFQHRDVATLSGGQAGRVALARALAPHPRLLLLDEPFVALDRDLRDRLGAEVRELLKRLGVPALHVTHDPHEAALVADRAITLAPSGDGSSIVAT
jgi:thiamine transport system ATP-binding protein